MLRIGLSYDEGKPEYGRYASALVEAGERLGIVAEPIWLAGLNHPFQPKLLDDLAGVVLTGGADVAPERYGLTDSNGLCRPIRERDDAELPLVRAVVERELPVLAICRGMQLLNVVCGGTLVPDLPGHDDPDESGRHTVALAPDSFLERVVGRSAGDVSSSHHQAVDRPGQGLRVVAESSGDGIVEAIEWENPQNKAWLVAVQWHPERMSLDEPLSGRLYAGFLRTML